MRGSALSFTFAFAALGCGSDPDGVAQPGGVENPTDPAVVTGVQPPLAVGLDRAARADETAEPRTPGIATPRSLKERIAVPAAIDCVSPETCTGNAHR